MGAGFGRGHLLLCGCGAEEALRLCVVKGPHDPAGEARCGGVVAKLSIGRLSGWPIHTAESYPKTKPRSRLAVVGGGAGLYTDRERALGRIHAGLARQLRERESSSLVRLTLLIVIWQTPDAAA